MCVCRAGGGITGKGGQAQDRTWWTVPSTGYPPRSTRNRVEALSKHCPSTIQAMSKRGRFASKLCLGHMPTLCVYAEMCVSQLRPSNPFIILKRKTIPETVVFSDSCFLGLSRLLEFYHGLFLRPWPLLELYHGHFLCLGARLANVSHHLWLLFVPRDPFGECLSPLMAPSCASGPVSGPGWRMSLTTYGFFLCLGPRLANVSHHLWPLLVPRGPFGECIVPLEPV
jgi:hypothetical protein